MKLIILFIFIFQIQFVYAINSYEKGDTLYIWADSGLSFRKSPDLNEEKIGKIEYGNLIVVVDDNLKVYPFTVTEITPFKNEISNIQKFVINGFGVKVNFDGQEGYVFDGYLSKLPTLDFVYQYNGDILVHKSEDFEFYGKRNFTLLSSSVETYKINGIARRNQAFANGMKHTFVSSNIYSETVKIPDISFKEAYLFANILFSIDTDINVYKSDGNVPVSIITSKNEINITYGQVQVSIILKNGIATLGSYASC